MTCSVQQLYVYIDDWQSHLLKIGELPVQQTLMSAGIAILTRLQWTPDKQCRINKSVGLGSVTRKSHDTECFTASTKKFTDPSACRRYLLSAGNNVH